MASVFRADRWEYCRIPAAGPKLVADEDRKHQKLLSMTINQDVSAEFYTLQVFVAPTGLLRYTINVPTIGSFACFSEDLIYRCDAVDLL